MDRLARTGDFETRSAAGAAFRREHANGTAAKAAYDACVGREAKKEFRARWAREKYSRVSQGRLFEETWSEVDQTMREMMTFGALVKHDGGFEWGPAI